MVQVMWRYTILYMTERCYESGGLLWDQVFNHVCWCLFIFEFFTGARQLQPHVPEHAPYIKSPKGNLLPSQYFSCPGLRTAEALV